MTFFRMNLSANNIFFLNGTCKINSIMSCSKYIFRIIAYKIVGMQKIKALFIR